MIMLSIRLSKETESRLSDLSARTHRSKSFYAKEAIERFLNDDENFYELICSYEESLRKKGKKYLLQEAHRQSLLASNHEGSEEEEDEKTWEENADTTGWQD